MRNKTVNVLMFTVGAAIGSAVTWKLLKRKYEEIAREEIESVKQVFSEMYKKEKEDTSGEESEDDSEEDEWLEETDEECDLNWDKESIETHKEYVNIANQYKGSQESTLREAIDSLTPYIIEPEEFDEMGYETVSLYYYNDDILATEDGEVVDNIDSVVGLEAIDVFGEIDDYAVYVRNPRLRTDYEILRSAGNFEESVDDE